MATPRPRSPRARPWLPRPTSATDPIAAARSTLGCGPGEQHESDDADRAHHSSQRPRTRSHRATVRANPTTSVRLVPDTARRWVRPVVRKSSARPGSRPSSSPSTNAGTSDLSLGREACHRGPERRAKAGGGSPPRPGRRTDGRGPVGGQDSSDIALAARREVAVDLDGRTQGHRAPTAVAEEEHRLAKLERTSLGDHGRTVRCTITCSPNRLWTGTGSPATVRSPTPPPAGRARPVSGLSPTRCARTSAAVATAPNTTSTPARTVSADRRPLATSQAAAGRSRQQHAAATAQRATPGPAAHRPRRGGQDRRPEVEGARRRRSQMVT